MRYALRATLAAAILLAPAFALAAGSADVTLVVEPLSSAPPLYPGKPVVPLGGSARVVALADFTGASGKAIDPASLSYAWNVDGVEQLASEGVGKRVLIADAPLEYRTSTVTVSVTSADGALSANASVDLAAAEPIVRIYDRDPLMGVRFDAALPDTFSLAGSEATLYAAPYSFPTALGAPALSWFVGGALSQTGNLITLRPTGQGAGTATVSVTAASKGSIDAPAASDSLTVSFGSAGGGGFFGL
ncbi:MAG: hypothetical protein KGI03_00420 [Patescibacteria group bacterium]|nr:hypothetical protein [Patescibacteria group bacterium]